MAKDTATVSQDAAGGNESENATNLPPTQKESPADNSGSVYTVDELIAGYKAFDVAPEVVATALKLEKKDSATEAEAKSIIDKFMKQKQEVKS
jgi:hypothetical protein